jgi:effector-binding domain-containing protein
MSVGFFPSRESMYKEIQQWIATNKLEMLMSLCNCCAYKALEYTGAYRCRSCHVRKGIIELTHEDKRASAKKEELLVVY